MTRDSLPTPPDHGPSWSSWLAVAAVPLAVAALLVAPGFNGLSLLSVVAAILSIARRVVEYSTRRTADTHERIHP